MQSKAEGRGSKVVVGLRTEDGARGVRAFAGMETVDHPFRERP